MLRVGPEPSASQSDKTYGGVNFPEEYSNTMYGIPTTILGSTNEGKGYSARLSSGHATATSTGYRVGSLSGYVPAMPTSYGQCSQQYVRFVRYGRFWMCGTVESILKFYFYCRNRLITI